MLINCKRKLKTVFESEQNIDYKDCYKEMIESKSQASCTLNPDIPIGFLSNSKKVYPCILFTGKVPGQSGPERGINGSALDLS